MKLRILVITVTLILFIACAIFGVEQDTTKSKTKKIYKKIAPPGKTYFSGIFGFGPGFEKVFTGIGTKRENDEDDELDKVNIYPGGGINLEANFGYFFTPTFRMELGIGYQSSGKTFENGDVSIKRYPLKIHFFKDVGMLRSFNVAIGVGAAYNMSPIYHSKVGDREEECEYEPSTAIHASINFNKFIENKPYFVFGEFRYVGAVKYEWKKATVNGSPAVPISDFEELNGDGIQFNFGIGYFF